MKVYGYEKNGEDLLELEEMTFLCNLEELDEIIQFLQYVKKEHTGVNGETESCHTHLQDWKDNWTKGSTDIIVQTECSNNNKGN